MFRESFKKDKRTGMISYNPENTRKNVRDCLIIVTALAIFQLSMAINETKLNFFIGASINTACALFIYVYPYQKAKKEVKKEFLKRI